MHELPARRRVVAIGSRLRISGHGQYLTVAKVMPPRGLEAPATDSPYHTVAKVMPPRGLEAPAPQIAHTTGSACSPT